MTTADGVAAAESEGKLLVLLHRHQELEPHHSNIHARRRPKTFSLSRTIVLAEYSLGSCRIFYKGGQQPYFALSDKLHLASLRKEDIQVEIEGEKKRFRKDLFVFNGYHSFES